MTKAGHIQIKTVTFRGRTSSRHLKVFVGRGSVARAKKDFDGLHEHDRVGCDYCRSKWRRKPGWWVRAFDNDGAFVKYEVLRVRVEVS